MAEVGGGTKIQRTHSSFWVSAYVSTYLAASMGMFAVFFVTADSRSFEEEASPLFVGAWLVLYVVSLALLFWRRWYFMGRSASLYMLLILFLPISTIWSGLPAKSFSYSMVLVLNFAFCLLVAKLFSWREINSIIVVTILWMVFIGLVLYLIGYQNVLYFDPANRETVLGTLPIRGLFNHKITAGFYVVICFVFCMALLTGWRRIFCCSVLFFFILMTGAATAIVMLMVAFLFLIAFLAKRRVSIGLLIVASLSIGIALFSMALLFGDLVLEMLGRDVTLTGRTLLWEWGLEKAFERPLLGWGYLGYFGTADSQSYVTRFREFANYNVPHFHNSYIQIFVESGIFVLMVYVFFIGHSIVRYYRYYLCRSDGAAIGVVVALFVVLIGGMITSQFLRYNNFISLYVCLAYILAPSTNDGLRKN